MMKFLVLGLFCFRCVYGNEALEEYFSYIHQLDQPRGDYREGEIEIVTDPVEIAEIEKRQESRLLQKGFSAEEAAEFSRVGIVNEDAYWIWVRDAVYFPGGGAGTYDRLLRRNEFKSKFPGVAILPILPSGEIVLILTYRHATRSWELEIPRGGIEREEALEEAALRELKEETGLIASSVEFLGEIAPDTGVVSIVPVFIGKVAAQEESNPEYSEVIAGALAFTKEELKAGIIQGFLEVSVQGTKRQVPLRDAFLTFALLQAEWRKML